jgi:hypothetical protein
MPVPDRRALLAAVLLFVALALFGQRYHWVEEAGTAERDGYVAEAEQILHGELPHDPFRPLLYPLLIAGLAQIVGDSFLAARLLSNLAAAALAWLAWATGRRLAPPTRPTAPATRTAVGTAAGWAMALLAVNPNLWILGQHVTTDMLFAALGAAALLAGLVYLESPGPRPALAAGLAFGLAAFTRSNALFLLPALLLAWLWAPSVAPGAEKSRRQRLGHLALALGAAVLVLLPHWALRQAVFGSPFHDENWKNLAWKLHGYPDWSYLDRVPYRNAWEIVRESPGAIVRGGVSELARFAEGGLAQLLGTWAQVLLFLFGAAWALRSRPRPAAWLLFAGASFLGAAAFSFFTWGRLLLLLLPASYALAFSPWGGTLMRRWGRWAPAAIAAALVLLLAVKTFGFRVPAFVAHHPYREVATLKRLDVDLPPGARLAGTSPFLGRYLRHGYLNLPDAFGPEVTNPALYYAKLARFLHGSGVVDLVVGEVDLRDRPAALLEDRAPVPWLAPLGTFRTPGRVRTWKVLAP